MDGAVDLQEEEMEQSVFGESFLPSKHSSRKQNQTSCLIFWSVSGLRFVLDPSRVPPSLQLSSSSLTVTYQGEASAVTPDPGVLPHVCADVVVARGQYYWEVDVCNSSVFRIGKNSPQLVWVGLVPESFTIIEQD